MWMQSPFVGIVLPQFADTSNLAFLISAIPFSVIPMGIAVFWLLTAYQTPTKIDVVILAAGFAVGTSFSSIMSFVLAGITPERWASFSWNLTLMGLNFLSGTLSGLVVLRILKTRYANENPST